MQFPIDLSITPNNYSLLISEPEFDAEKHLALEKPHEIFSLADLGYSESEIAECPTAFAATSVFRVLSDEGVACLYDVIKQLEAYTTSNARIERCVRGGVYRSKFLRDLCVSSDVAEFMSGLAGIELMPHTIPHQLGHLNYHPHEIGKDVDKWHVDTLRFDYVMFVTDPTKVKGGAFQYFKGTKTEIGALRQAGKPVPADRVIAPEMPGAGYAILQQGNMVVHQAKGLTEPGERVTMVNGYIANPMKAPDYTRYDQLLQVDPSDVVTAEYARHVAFQAREKLDASVAGIDFIADQNYYASQLESIADALQQAVSEMRDTTEHNIEHFGN